MGSTKHIGHQVVAMMDRIGISPITRNYHLCYICIANSDPPIRQAVRNLGKFPTQLQLDQVIEEHCAEALDSYTMKRHESAVLEAIDDLSLRLQSEQSQLSGFNSAIENMSVALARSVERDQLTSDLLMKVVGAIGQAGNSRVAAGQRTLQRMREKRTEVDALREELVRVRRMANTDVLTGLANRRHFDDRLAAAMGKSPDFALLLLDIDHFKSVNDVHGHAFGDHVLKCVATAIAKVSRAGAFVARTGGEEFAVVVTRATEEDALAVAERLRLAVEGLAITIEGQRVGVSISVGIAMSKGAVSGEHVYKSADAALYRSKDAGRNRVSLHGAGLDDETGQRYRIYGS